MIPIDNMRKIGMTAMPASSFWLAHCRMGERVVIAFFLYTAVLCVFQDCAFWKKAAALLVPMVYFGLACVETSHGSRGTRIARDWMIPVAVLAAYWQMGWIATVHDTHIQQSWLAWDRWLLDGWGLRSLIESQGKVIPWCLDLAYLLLYYV